MIGDRDAAVFFNPRTFAKVAAFHPAEMSGEGFPLAGIFTKAHAEAGGVSMLAPVFTIDRHNVRPRMPERGDRLYIPGEPVHRVADIQPDGAGLVRLILEAF